MKKKEANEYIVTYSGQLIDPQAPTIDQIKLIDIAYGLSNIKRYGGQTRISVLRHSLALSQCAEGRQEALFALLHDAAEAYAGDVTTSIRPYIGKAWHKLYEAFEALIYEKYGVEVTPEQVESVMTVDKQVVEYEMDSREIYEMGSKIAFPCERKLTQQEYSLISSYYNWGMSDDQLIPVFMAAVRALTSRMPPQESELPNDLSSEHSQESYASTPQPEDA